MINFGPVPIGAVLPIFFDSFAGATGASITISGLAVTDIEVYKGTSMTQRSSDAGYVLLDTDGIDLDGVTGIHGFSIDTGDNTDASFYASGSFYTVVVSAITVDSQTVNFVAATFRCVTAESVAGQPKVDTAAFGGTAGTFASGRPEVNTTNLAGQTVTAAAGVTFPTSVASPTNITAGTITTVTNLTNLPTIPANWLTASGMDSTAGEEIADAILGRNVSGGSSSGRTVKQALHFIRNKWVVSAGTLTVYDTDDSTSSWTAAVTGTAGADPITANDPA